VSPIAVELTAMEMDTRNLLPGVTTDGYEPKVRCDSRPIIVRARRLTMLRDIAQLLIVVAVDWLFVRWPLSHVPVLDRHDSVLLVVLFNAIVLAHVIVSRKLPHWSARRIAATWSAAERTKFATTLPQRAQR
jgi:hypothetical protein